MKVVSVADYRGPAAADGLVDVYDLTVAGTHLYAAGGVVVSNSKRISMLDVNALLSHGAVETLRDAGGVRGQRNEDWWLQFMNGHTPRAPRVPLVYEKFVAQLKAAGIDVVREGFRTHLKALTDADVDKLTSGRVVRSGDTVHFDRDLKPVAGGLFDPQLTGGHGGRQWAAVALPEPLPNPAMEEPVRHLLGLTQKQLEDVLAGEHELPGGRGTGPAAVARALDAVDLDREIRAAEAQWGSGKATLREKAVRKWGVLKDCKRLGLHPRDWVLTKAPVLPPAFRPVSVLGNTGVPLVADANYLYKELMEAARNLTDMKGELGEEGVGPERRALYHAFRATVGLADPVHPKLREKRVGGVLKSIFGSSPKFGTVQRRLLSSTVDNVGRAVIVPNPEFDMDTIGVPENQAFSVYTKFLARRLRRRGLPLREALRHIKDKTPLARDALVEELDERPVYVNRAPVLHRFGIMAFRPRLVAGDVLQVSPLIVKGFNADFDGDTMQFHVPTTDEAVREAYDRMLPSRNLLSPADFKSAVHAPGQEYQGALFTLTRAPRAGDKRRPRVFRNRDDVKAAFARGELRGDEPVVVVDG